MICCVSDNVRPSRTPPPPQENTRHRSAPWLIWCRAASAAIRRLAYLRTPAGAHVGQALVKHLLITGVVAVLRLPSYVLLPGAAPRAFVTRSAGRNDLKVGTITAALAVAYTYPASDEQRKN